MAELSQLGHLSVQNRRLAELFRARGDAAQARGRLKAPLIHSVKGQDIMAYDDPRWMGGIGMIGSKAVYDAVMHCDLFLMLGTDYPYSEFLPHRAAVIQVDDNRKPDGPPMACAGDAKLSLL